jgi:hypothetical protein
MGKVEANGNTLCQGYPRQPCRYSASHSSRDRSRADNHGQCNGGRDLRRLSSDQVTIILELALQAGSRLVEACIGLAVPGRPIGPGRGGPERQRRPRPDGLA